MNKILVILASIFWQPAISLWIRQFIADHRAFAVKTRSKLHRIAGMLTVKSIATYVSFWDSDGRQTVITRIADSGTNGRRVSWQAGNLRKGTNPGMIRTPLSKVALILGVKLQRVLSMMTPARHAPMMS